MGKLNHLLFMDGTLLFSKTEPELDNLVKSVRIFSNDIKMKFEFSESAMMVTKRGKFARADCNIVAKW